jgi:hypothetical protein
MGHDSTMAAMIDEYGGRAKNKRCVMKNGRWTFCHKQEQRLAAVGQLGQETKN